MKNNGDKTLTFASLFSGIGGADIAATAVGWEHKFWCEWDEFCQTVLKYWFNHSIGYGDITKTNFTKWRGKIDVLHASPPCQSVSVAGKRMGTRDDRFLWGDTIRALAEIRPTWFTFENVAGIESMVESVPTVEMEEKTGLDEKGGCVYTGKSTKLGVLYGIIKEAEIQGYSVQIFNIPACAIGAPHERKRVWIVGHLANSGHTGAEIQCKRSDAVLSERDASDSQSKQVGRSQFKQPKNRAAEQIEYRGRGGEDGSFWESEDFWRSFPTKSPVCRGNDGFPIRVDTLTIPFRAWRREAIKAYGNAIVPQVLYQIYNAINKIENGSSI